MNATDELAPWTYVAAYALCVDVGDRVLLCRVAPGYDSSGQWTLPGGGLAFGEDPQAGVLRELTEETGLSGAVESLAFVDSHTGGPLVERGRALGPYHAIRIVYRVTVRDGDLRNETDGSTDTAAWFTRGVASQLPLMGLARAALDYLGSK